MTARANLTDAALQIFFFFWTCWMALRWQWKQRWQDYPLQALQRLPISYCCGKNKGEYSEMKVTCKQCREEGSGSIVLKSKTVPGLRFAAERHGPHTSKEDNWLFKRLQNEVLKLETDSMPQGSSIVAYGCFSQNTVRWISVHVKPNNWHSHSNMVEAW